MSADAQKSPCSELAPASGAEVLLVIGREHRTLTVVHQAAAGRAMLETEGVTDLVNGRLAETLGGVTRITRAQAAAKRR